MSQGGRRLAAIMFTDMVGFTALTQSDEAQSLAVLERHNRLLRPIFPRFHGREVKTIGDSFLVEFDSALDATNCAVDIQQFLHDYNISSKDEWRIALRIGVHLGDVVHSGGDILGDAVNVASRLQPLAEPEGVCISEQVYDQVRNKIPQGLVKLAPQDLKGVKFAVDLYKVLMPWDHEPAPSHLVSGRHRIAILPFASLSPDPNDEYFADGLTEELIDRLCQIKDLEVIARTSVMSFKRKEMKAADIGRELRVGSLVEGSVRKAGNRIRVTAQLINAVTEGHLWSAKYDRELDDVFALQTDVAEKVAGALQVELLPGEKKAIEHRRTENMEAYTLYLQGRQLWNRRTKTAVNAALECFNGAIRIDPRFALAHVGVSDCYDVMENFGDVQDSEIGTKVKESALKALELDRNLAEAHTSYAAALAQYEWKWAESEAEFKRAIELNPSYATAHQWYGRMLLRFTGRLDEDMREAERALELDPLAPVMKFNKGQVLYFMGRYEEWLECMRSALQIDPEFFPAQMGRDYALLLLGRVDEAVALFQNDVSGWSLTESQKKLSWVNIYALSGRKDEALRILAEVKASKDRSILPTDFAVAYRMMGQVDEMFDFLEQALLQRSFGLPWVLTQPEMKPFLGDPRLQELKRKVGI